VLFLSAFTEHAVSDQCGLGRERRREVLSQERKTRGEVGSVKLIPTALYSTDDRSARTIGPRRKASSLIWACHITEVIWVAFSRSHWGPCLSQSLRRMNMHPRKANDKIMDRAEETILPTPITKGLWKRVRRLRRCLNGRCAARPKVMADFEPYQKPT